MLVLCLSAPFSSLRILCRVLLSGLLRFISLVVVYFLAGASIFFSLQWTPCMLMGVSLLSVALNRENVSCGFLSAPLYLFTWGLYYHTDKTVHCSVTICTVKGTNLVLSVQSKHSGMYYIILLFQFYILQGYHNSMLTK